MTNAEKKVLQQIILRHMEAHDFDQKAMAAQLGVTQSTLSAWLSDEPGKGHGIAKKHIERIKYVCRDVNCRDINIIGSQVQHQSADAVEAFRAGLIGAIILIDGDAATKDAVLKLIATFGKQQQ